MTRKSCKGYPYGDGNAWPILCSFATDRESSIRTYATFLEAQLTATIELVKIHKLSEAKLWRDYLAVRDNRNAFYRKVVALLPSFSEKHAPVNDTESVSGSVADPKPAKNIGKSLAPTPHVASRLGELLNELAFLLGRNAEAKGLPTVAPVIAFYIDEAHELERGIAVATVNRVFADVKSSNVNTKGYPAHVVVLTSTSSRLSELAPSRWANLEDPSTRWMHKHFSLVTPFSQMSYNVFLQAAVNDLKRHTEKLARLSANQVWNLDFAVCIGRPLCVKMLGSGSVLSIFTGGQHFGACMARKIELLSTALPN